MNIVELYEFTIGSPKQIYRYTSAATPVTPTGWPTYLPMVVERSDIKTSSALSGNTVSIYLGLAEDVADILMHYPSDARGSIVIRRVTDGVVTNLYQGKIRSIGVQNDVMTLTCGDILGDTQNLLNVSYFTRNCRHLLYSAQCGVDKESVKETINIISYNTSDKTIVFSAANAPFEPDYFTGGFIDPGFLIVHTTGLGTPPDPIVAKIADIGSGTLSTGTSFAYPGCDRTPATCRAKFDNVINYGGFSLAQNRG